MPWKGRGPATSGLDGVDVHLLAEAVAVEKEGARAARGRERGQPRGVEGQCHHVAGPRDHEEVVAPARAARARRPGACSGPGRASRARARRPGHSRSETGARPSGATSAEKPRSDRSARSGAEAPGARGALRRGAQRDAVPVDAHVGDEAQAAARARADARQVERRWSAAGPPGPPRPGPGRSARSRPRTSSDRRLQAPAPLGRRHVVARERVVGPGGQEQQGVARDGTSDRSRMRPWGSA